MQTVHWQYIVGRLAAEGGQPPIPGKESGLEAWAHWDLLSGRRATSEPDGDLLAWLDSWLWPKSVVENYFFVLRSKWHWWTKEFASLRQFTASRWWLAFSPPLVPHTRFAKAERPDMIFLTYWRRRDNKNIREGADRANKWRVAAALPPNSYGRWKEAYYPSGEHIPARWLRHHIMSL